MYFAKTIILWCKLFDWIWFRKAQGAEESKIRPQASVVPAPCWIGTTFTPNTSLRSGAFHCCLKGTFGSISRSFQNINHHQWFSDYLLKWKLIHLWILMKLTVFLECFIIKSMKIVLFYSWGLLLMTIHINIIEKITESLQ